MSIYDDFIIRVLNIDADSIKDVNATSDDDGNLIKHVNRTEDIRPYISQMITEGDAKGTVMVTEELAEILQEMMDCYIFNGVEHQWTKLCYYFKTISK